MQCWSLAALCALVTSACLLSGCGSSSATASATAPPSTTTPTVPAGPIDGRWSISPFTTPPAGSTLLPPVNGAQFQGALSTQGSLVTGAGLVSFVAVPGSANFGCVRSPQNVVLHGTFNAARHLSLLSDASSDGSVLQIELDISADPHQRSIGTSTFTSSCVTAKSDAGGMLFEPMQGTFNGPVAGIDPMTQKQATLGTATAVLSETDPDATGSSQVTGDLAVQFSTCSIHIPVNETRIGSSASSGSILGLPLPLPSVLILDEPDGRRLNATFLGLGQDCKAVAVVPPSITNGMIASLTKQ